MDAEEVGPSLRNATAKVVKTTRGGQGSGGFGGGQGGQGGGGYPSGQGSSGSGGQPNDDPWMTTAPAGGSTAGGWGGAGSANYEEPPF